MSDKPTPETWNGRNLMLEINAIIKAETERCGFTIHMAGVCFARGSDAKMKCPQIFTSFGQNAEGVGACADIMIECAEGEGEWISEKSH